MKKLLVFLSTVLIATLAGSGWAWGTTEHCPDFNSPNKVESQTDGDLDGIVLPAGTKVCVKGSTVATGIVIADGVKTLYEILGIGKNVSYYITYTVTPTPTPTSPTPTPTTPTPTPTETETTPVPTETPSVTPTPTNTQEPRDRLPKTGANWWLAVLGIALLAGGSGIVYANRRS